MSKQNLPIVTTTIYPRIENRIANFGGTPHTLEAPMTKEVITDAARRSAWVNRTRRHEIRTDRDGTTPGNFDIAVRSPRHNSPVLIGGIGVYPASGHSGILQDLNKLKSTSPEKIRDTQKLDTSVDRSFPDDLV